MSEVAYIPQIDKPKFLILDDEELNRLIIGGNVQKYGGTAIAAENIEELMENFRLNPDASGVILDLYLTTKKLPEPNGVQALIKLRDAGYRNRAAFFTGNIYDVDDVIERYNKPMGETMRLFKPAVSEQLFKMFDYLLNK